MREGREGEEKGEVEGEREGVRERKREERGERSECSQKLRQAYYLRTITSSCQ